MQKFMLVAFVFIASAIGCTSSSHPSQVSMDEIGLDANTVAERDFVVLKFGATWCPPCRKLDQSLAQLDRSHRDNLVVQKIDIDKEPDLTSRFGVSSIPHTFLVKNGTVVDNIVGYRSHGELTVWVGAHEM